MSASASVKPGDVLAGKYRVERVLGAGGMGYVVAARHLQLDQLVAMKFLRTGAVDNEEASARFLREAKAVVKLRNEHIAKVFDVGTLETGEPYIVMEFLDGCDLAALAKQRHVFPVQEACEYVMQACEALAEAHALGIVHRDIKLANLFITSGPAGGPLVKVLDFGISKTNPFGESEHDMTRTASMLGSPRFMSPEQMRDPRLVDARSDIWSLGVVLYRLVAGHPPFEADTLGRLITMVMHEQEPPLSASRPDLPPGFELVVSRCLQKDPAMRFANVAELAYALVPYSLDPARARAAADRISAVLAVPPITGTGSNPMLGAVVNASSSRGRVSMPPGASDTGGTASPWTGTHGGSRRPPAGSKGTTIWLGVALAGLLVGTGIFAMVRHNRTAAGTTTTATTTEAPPPSASPALAPSTPATQPPPAYAVPASVETAPPAQVVPTAPTVIGASPLPPEPPSTGFTTRAEPTTRRPAAPSRPKPTHTQRAASPVPAPGPAPAPAPAPKHDDGIPATRD
jgi:serine/threonine-protein kinase